jgi:hypothetical protein
MVNAQALPDADTRPFSIADWIARASDGIPYRMTDRNPHVAELAGVMEEMPSCTISGNGFVFTLLGG